MNILAIGAHPDDIEFGCAGALIRMRRDRGAKAFLMVMTCGEKGGTPDLRRKEQMEAARIIGAQEVFWADFHDTELTNSREAIGSIERVLAEVKPDLVITNLPNDTHQDHRNLALNVITATRYISQVLFFESMTSVDFLPSMFISLDDAAMEEKLKSLAAHRSQVERTHIAGMNAVEIARSHAHSRGIQARARYAEGYVPLRYVL
ncbi:MAG: PIG-L family deacetylase [Nitrospirae bacterium]|nr:PIG-L family deacetylase [Nitrospirota bacterium]